MRFTRESHKGPTICKPYSSVQSVVQYDDATHAFHAGVAQGPTIYKPYQSVSQLFNMTMLSTHFTQEPHRGRRFTNPTVQFSQSVSQLFTMTMLPTYFTQESHRSQRFTNPKGPTICKPYQSVSQLFNMTMLHTHFTQESHRGRRFTNPTVQFRQSVSCSL